MPRPQRLGARARNRGGACDVIVNGRVRFKALDQLQAEMVAGALRLYADMFSCGKHCPAGQITSLCTCGGTTAVAQVLKDKGKCAPEDVELAR